MVTISASSPPSTRLIRRASIAMTTLVLLFGAVEAVGTGCANSGANEQQQQRRASAPHLTAARLGSRTPTLPLFVIRIAQSDLPLSEKQPATIAEIATDADAATHPIDDARIVFLEVLAHSAEQGSELPTIRAKAAADQVVRATEEAAPQLATQIEKLHGTLTAWQRRTLVELVTKKVDGWAPIWEAAQHRAKVATLDGTTGEWISALQGEDTTALAATMTLDTTKRARQWTTDLVERLETDLPKLDLAQRRALAVRLRTDTLVSNGFQRPQ